MSRTRTIADKIRHVCAKNPTLLAGSDFALVTEIWRTFFWAYVDLRFENGGVVLTVKENAMLSSIPSWEEIIKTRRRLLREHQRSPTPPIRGEPRMPYKDPP